MKKRYALYGVVNVGFFVLLGVVYASGASPNPRIVYLVALFALCSTPVIDTRRLNDEYAMLNIFLCAYFLMFGVGDVSALSAGTITETSAAPLSLTECVILVGLAILIAGYRVVASGKFDPDVAARVRDWSARSMFVVGLAMWAFGTMATYQWYVYIVVDTSNEALRKGITSHSQFAISASILMQMMQPLGMLLMIYLWRKRRIAFMGPLVLAMVALQVVLGFIADIKGLAMLGGILVIIASVLIQGRLPKLWLAGALAYAIVVFPIFQAYRTEVHGNRGIARTAVAQDLGRALALALSAEDRVNSGSHRAQSLLERSSLRGSVQMIVEKTGNGVPFQHGHTLTPILATFVPRIVWSDKPDVATGQLVNKQFHVTEGDDVYISPSQLGELYWNYGWPGVIAGMAIIGVLLGLVGTRCNFARASSVTRLLIFVVTIKQVVMGFEGVIGASYVVWLRSLAGIGVLHVMFARLPAASGSSIITPPKPASTPIPAVGVRAFSNLLH